MNFRMQPHRDIKIKAIPPPTAGDWSECRSGQGSEAQEDPGAAAGSSDHSHLNLFQPARGGHSRRLSVSSPSMPATAIFPLMSFLLNHPLRVVLLSHDGVTRTRLFSSRIGRESLPA